MKTLTKYLVDAHAQSSFDKKYQQGFEFVGQIIYCAHAKLSYMSPPLYSRNQIFVGPRDATNYGPGASEGFINTEFGAYRLQNYLNKYEVPPPALTIVHVDEFLSNIPEDIEKLPGRKIMILGDTHQTSAGINKVRDYFIQKDFDYYLADCKKNHLHFFSETRPQRHYEFFPCFRNRFETTHFNAEKKLAVSLIGQMKATHPYRLLIAEKLKESGVPSVISEAQQSQAIQIYQSFLINVNVSLNNDFNMRFTEVISAGGFLLTDRISPFTGYQDVFVEGEDFIFYDSAEDLLDKVRYYIAHPKEAIRIAKSGWTRYHQTWSIKKRRAYLSDLVSLGKPINTKVEDVRYSNLSAEFSQMLDFRIQFYGFMQEMNKQGYWTVLIPENVHRIVLNDTMDLCRVELKPYVHYEDVQSTIVETKALSRKCALVGTRDALANFSNNKQLLQQIEKVIQV